jgi:hypothetical protein
MQPRHLDQLAHKLVALRSRFHVRSTQVPRLLLQLLQTESPARALVRKRVFVAHVAGARATPAHETVVLEFPRAHALVVDHVAVRNRDFVARGDVGHGVHRLLADRGVPRKARVGVAVVVEARGVREHGRAVVHFHAVGLEDAGK